jgi:RNA polymerase sigma factor (sigma-70 family)
MPNASLNTMVRQLRSLAVGETVAEETDRDLLQRFLAGRDEAAFAALVRRHAVLVWNVCRRILRHDQDAEDAWQATFLVLARNAAGIRKAEALASFLHGVAHRTALRAKRSAATRRTHERQEKNMPRRAPPTDITWREVQAVLDDEVRRLPEKYRAAFVLCCLQEKSRHEAARELGWSEGTLSSRLAQARKLLQQRLTRRGVTLAALLASTSLARLRAAPLPALVRSTIPAALSYAAHPAAGRRLVSTSVAALAEGVTRSMTLGKLKIASVLLILAGIGAAGAGWLGPPSSECPAPAQAVAAPPVPSGPRLPAATPSGAAHGKSVAVTGQVLAPDGKPLAGAKVYCSFSLALPRPGLEGRAVRATTAADGRFRFEVLRAELDKLERDTPWDKVMVVVAAPGYGPAWGTFTCPEEAVGLKLRLAKDDVPVAGRILDLEGRPIPGVTVRATAIEAVRNDDLDAWITLTRQTKTPWNDAWAGSLSLDAVPVLPRPETITDADGRFRLTGFGRHRIVALSLSGPTIVARAGDLSMLTGVARSFHVPLSRRNPEAGNLVYYGTNADIAAAPTKPIVGTVRDQETGKPLAGVTIQGQLSTQTDQNGHYRLVGMAKGKGHEIRAVAPSGQPYLRSRVEVPDTPGLAPVRVDFALKRGVWIRGKVTDGRTGQPVRARLRYAVFLDNPHLRGVPAYDGSETVVSGADGSYAVLGLPGRGLLAVKAEEDRFLPSVGADKVPQADKIVTNFELIETNPPLPTFEYHAFVSVNPPDDKKAFGCDVRLDPGRTVSGTLLDPEGKPLAGVTVMDLKFMWSHPQPLPGARFTVTALDPHSPRSIYFLHRDKHLGAAVLVRGDEDKPLTVRLQPCGTIKGRILDGSGRPWPSWSLYGQSESKSMSVSTGRWWELYVSGRTDEGGRFRVENLIPGVLYHLPIGPQNHPQTLRAGEVKDLGDIRIGGRAE